MKLSINANPVVVDLVNGPTFSNGDTIIGTVLHSVDFETEIRYIELELVGMLSVTYANSKITKNKFLSTTLTLLPEKPEKIYSFKQGLFEYPFQLNFARDQYMPPSFLCAANQKSPKNKYSLKRLPIRYKNGSSSITSCEIKYYLETRIINSLNFKPDIALINNIYFEPKAALTNVNISRIINSQNQLLPDHCTTSFTKSVESETSVLPSTQVPEKLQFLLQTSLLRKEKFDTQYGKTSRFVAVGTSLSNYFSIKLVTKINTQVPQKDWDVTFELLKLKVSLCADTLAGDKILGTKTYDLIDCEPKVVKKITDFVQVRESSVLQNEQSNILKYSVPKELLNVNIPEVYPSFQFDVLTRNNSLDIEVELEVGGMRKSIKQSIALFLLPKSSLKQDEDLPMYSAEDSPFENDSLSV